jgi:alpha-1,2-mannosyltransferase
MRDAYGIRLLRQPGVQLAVLWFLAVVALIFRGAQLAFLTTQPQWGYDLSFYWTAASHLLDGEPIYSAAQLAGPYAPQGQDGFLYPPPFAALAIPLVWLAPGGAATAEWLWSGLGLVLLVAVALALHRSERLGERFAALRGRGRWLVVIAAVTFPPVIGELSIGNVHLVLLSLLTLAWLGIRRGDTTGVWLTGIGIGTATVIKVFPGVLILWLLLTGRVRAAATSVIAGAVLVLVTLPITGIEPWLQYPTVLANLSAVVETQDTISPTIWLEPAIGFTAARLIVTAVGLAVLAWAAIRGGRSAAPATSFGLAVVISVLIAPNVFHHYLAIFVLPMLLALGAGVGIAWLAVGYVLMSGGKQPALGELSWIVNRVMPTAGMVSLFAGLIANVRGAHQGADRPGS